MLRCQRAGAEPLSAHARRNANNFSNIIARIVRHRQPQRVELDIGTDQDAKIDAIFLNGSEVTVPGAGFE